MIWSKLKSHFSKQGEKQGEIESSESLVSKSNVNEEYMGVFRTKSYIEIHSELQARLLRKSLDRLSTSSSISNHQHSHSHSHSNYEPDSEILSDINIRMSEIPGFLLRFFQISLDARKICELILKSIQKTKANYSPMRSLLNQMKSVSDDEMDSYTYHESDKIYSRHAAFTSLSNPLSSVTPLQFQDLHDNLYTAVDMFTSKSRRIRKKSKVMKCLKKIAKGTLMAAYCATSVTLIVIAIHSIVGAVAAPCLIATSTALLKKQVRNNYGKKSKKRSGNQRLEAQLDAAGRGFYLMMNDFDTMSRLVMRLNDEIEHSKFIAGLCVRKRNNEMLKEVVKEMRVNGNGINSHLQELEEHVYLCILNLDRSRRLLIDKLVMD